MLLAPRHQVYRVVFDKATPCWTIQREGRSRPLTQATSKSVAVDLALKLARSDQTALVFVHRRDGSVETEHRFDAEAA